MENNIKEKNKRMGFAHWLTLLFIALKLTKIGEVSGWNWFWVLFPLIFYAGILFLDVFIKKLLKKLKGIEQELEEEINKNGE